MFVFCSRAEMFIAMWGKHWVQRQSNCPNYLTCQEGKIKHTSCALTVTFTFLPRREAWIRLPLNLDVWWWSILKRLGLCLLGGKNPWFLLSNKKWSELLEPALLNWKPCKFKLTLPIILSTWTSCTARNKWRKLSYYASSCFIINCVVCIFSIVTF